MKNPTSLLAVTTLVCKPMKIIPQLQLTRALRLRGTFLAVLAGCLAAGLAATHAAPPSLQIVPQATWPAWQGNWPTWPRGGEAQDVKVAGNYAYVVLGSAGLAVFDVSNPPNCAGLPRAWQELHDVSANYFLGVTEPGGEPHLAATRENGPVQLTLTGKQGSRYALETSTALPNWNSAAITVTVTNESDTVTFPAPGATNGAQRFYRALLW
jgi:hypothetical protein